MVEYILSLNVAAAKLPVRGLAPLTQHASAPGGTYHLKATYADTPRNGIHSLADSAEVVLRSPRVLTSGATSLKNVGIQNGAGPDGATHLQTTAYSSPASFTLGTLDLSGIASVTLDLRSRASKHPFTIELRADSASGALLGSADVRPTVGEQWYTQAIPLSASGEKPLYVVFHSPAPSSAVQPDRHHRRAPVRARASHSRRDEDEAVNVVTPSRSDAADGTSVASCHALATASSLAS